MLPRAFLLPFLALTTPAGAQLFLVDDTRSPAVQVSWRTTGGKEVSLRGQREYRGVNERAPLGGNIEWFVTVGGIRQARGVSDPRGTTIRLGFVKRDPARSFFDDLLPNTPIVFELSGVAFTRPAMPRPDTVIQELGYGLDPNLCGVPGQPDAQYNTASPTEDLRGKITVDNGRLGSLDGSEPSDGKVSFSVAPDGSISMRAEIPYALFRHLRDPWLNPRPGAFNEPNHFHIEFEVVPAEGVPASPPAPGRP